jgi:N-acetylmuramoyl-L-alanine amidase
MTLALLTTILCATTIADAPLIAIDAGHGGDLIGAIGVCGVQEKEIMLTIARELSSILMASGRVRVLQTRVADVEVSLETRVQMANQAKAALFLSLHANASENSGSQGFEVYFLSEHAADRRIARLALLENEGRAHMQELYDPLSQILGGLRMQAVHHASQQLAVQVHRTLTTKLLAHGRGIFQAPFFVLKHANMPSVLVEIGYLSHQQECEQLADINHRQQIVDGLATATLAYVMRRMDCLLTAATDKHCCNE